jgi:hypothetical protein
MNRKERLTALLYNNNIISMNDERSCLLAEGLIDAGVMFKDELPNEEDIYNVIEDFDGINIINAGYDIEPYINDKGLKSISKAIKSLIDKSKG